MVNSDGQTDTQETVRGHITRHSVFTSDGARGPERGEGPTGHSEEGGGQGLAGFTGGASMRNDALGVL